MRNIDLHNIKWVGFLVLSALSRFVAFLLYEMKNLIPDGLTNLSRGILTLLRTLYGKIAGIIGYPALIFCIDEAMVSYSGRTNHTTKMKNKPIAQGFKIWVLGDNGYVCD